jgi:hypothetical protein
LAAFSPSFELFLHPLDPDPDLCCQRMRIQPHANLTSAVIKHTNFSKFSHVRWFFFWQRICHVLTISIYKNNTHMPFFVFLRKYAIKAYLQICFLKYNLRLTCASRSQILLVKRQYSRDFRLLVLSQSNSR